MKPLSILLSLGLGVMLGSGIQRAADNYERSREGTPVIIATPQVDDQLQADLQDCVVGLNDYVLLSNRLFYTMAGAPEQIYWDDPFLYVPSDPEICNDAFDKLACAKADPDGTTFELQIVDTDGTAMLIPTNWKPHGLSGSSAPSPSATTTNGFDPSKSI